ncbi:MAG: hypothetical protein KJ607_00885, partial [Bacteroidetes bacterium]|nr:hypothetical protein [Bacteroidota bacterium]
MLLLLVLFLPALQKWIGFSKSEDLSGVSIPAGKPVATWENFFSGEFQPSYNQYVEEHIGFRNDFVRIYNQLDYSLFRHANASNVLIGKDNVLVQDFYVDAYTGKDYVGIRKIRKDIMKTKLVQNYLKYNGIDLVFVIAPGKVSVYKEYFGDFIGNGSTDSTNYELYSDEMKKNDINCIDFRKYFLEIKDTSRWP